MKLLGLKLLQLSCARSHGVMVSTLDFESSDPSSNLGGTWWQYICCSIVRVHFGTLNTGLFVIFINTCIGPFSIESVSYLDQYQTNCLTFRPLIQSQTRVKLKPAKSKLIVWLLSTRKWKPLWSHLVLTGTKTNRNDMLGMHAMCETFLFLLCKTLNWLNPAIQDQILVRPWYQ